MIGTVRGWQATVLNKGASGHPCFQSACEEGWLRTTSLDGTLGRSSTVLLNILKQVTDRLLGV